MLLCYKLTDPNPAMVDGNTDYTDWYRDIMAFQGGRV